MGRESLDGLTSTHTCRKRIKPFNWIDVFKQAYSPLSCSDVAVVDRGSSVDRQDRPRWTRYEQVPHVSSYVTQTPHACLGCLLVWHRLTLSQITILSTIADTQASSRCRTRKTSPMQQTSYRRYITSTSCCLLPTNNTELSWHRDTDLVNRKRISVLNYITMATTFSHWR